MTHAHRIFDVDAIKRFVRGGNARFTLVSRKTGARFTFRARTEDGKPTFVALLTGSDNAADYDFLGTIFADGTYRHGQRSRVSSTAPAAVAFAWFHGAIAYGTVPDTVEFWHEGRCGRCGRVLTVPESIATGFGPECAGLMGIPMQEVEHGDVPAHEWSRAIRDAEAGFDAEIRRREEDEERIRMNRKLGLPLGYGVNE